MWEDVCVCVCGGWVWGEWGGWMWGECGRWVWVSGRMGVSLGRMRMGVECGEAGGECGGVAVHVEGGGWG